jgi:hypothetical protein
MIKDGSAPLCAAKGTTHSIVTRFVAIITILSTFVIFSVQREAGAQTTGVTVTLSATEISEAGIEVLVTINPPQPQFRIMPQAGQIFPGRRATYGRDFTFVGFPTPISDNTSSNLIGQFRIAILQDDIPEDLEYIPLQIDDNPGVSGQEFAINIRDDDAGSVTITNPPARNPMTCAPGLVGDLRTVGTIPAGLPSTFATGTNVRSLVRSVALQTNGGESGTLETIWTLPLGIAGFGPIFTNNDPRIWEAGDPLAVLMCFQPETYVGFSQFQQTSTSAAVTARIERRRGILHTTPNFFVEDTVTSFPEQSTVVSQTPPGATTSRIVTFPSNARTVDFSFTATAASTTLQFSGSVGQPKPWPSVGPIFADHTVTVEPVPTGTTVVAFTTTVTSVLEGQTALAGRNLEIPILVTSSSTQPPGTTVVRYRLVRRRDVDNAFSTLTGSTVVNGTGRAVISIPVSDNAIPDGDEQWSIELVDGADYRVAAAPTAVSEIIVRDDECSAGLDSRPGRSFSMQVVSPCGKITVTANPATSVSETAASRNNALSFDFALSGQTSNGSERALVRIDVVNADGTPATPVAGDAGFDLNGDGVADREFATTVSFASSANPRLFISYASYHHSFGDNRLSIERWVSGDTS